MNKDRFVLLSTRGASLKPSTAEFLAFGTREYLASVCSRFEGNRDGYSKFAIAGVENAVPFSPPTAAREDQRRINWMANPPGLEDLRLDWEKCEALKGEEECLTEAWEKAQRELKEITEMRCAAEKENRHMPALELGRKLAELDAAKGVATRREEETRTLLEEEGKRITTEILERSAELNRKLLILTALRAEALYESRAAALMEVAKQWGVTEGPITDGWLRLASGVTYGLRGILDEWTEEIVHQAGEGWPSFNGGAVTGRAMAARVIGKARELIERVAEEEEEKSAPTEVA